MIHNQMSHNQAKKWVPCFIYRAAIDFKKSKKYFKGHFDLFEDEKDGRKHFFNFLELFNK